jgi:hypothetical protein
MDIEEPLTSEELSNAPYGDYGIKLLKDNIKYIEKRDKTFSRGYP